MCPVDRSILLFSERLVELHIILANSALELDVIGIYLPNFVKVDL